MNKPLTPEEIGQIAAGVIKPLIKRLDDLEVRAQRVPAAPRAPVAVTHKMSAIVGGLLTAKDQPHKSPLGWMDERGWGSLAREIEVSAKALNASSAVAGGILIPTDMSREIIELLRPSVGFLAGGPRRIPMPKGAYTLPGAATGAQASYTTEAQPAATTEPTFRDVNLSAKTLAAVVPATNDALQYSAADLEAFITADLVAAMGQKMDSSALRGNGVGGNPLGIFNASGITLNTATNTATPTLAQVDADLRKCIAGMVRANIPMSSVKWVIHPLVIGYLQDVRSGNGDAVFPTLFGERKTLKNIPVVETTNLPIDEGVGLNETTIGLVAFDHVLFGESAPLELAVSREATLEINGTTLSLFQRRMTAVLAVMQHDFALRHAKAVSLLTGVKWGLG